MQSSGALPSTLVRPARWSSAHQFPPASPNLIEATTINRAAFCGAAQAQGSAGCWSGSPNLLGALACASERSWRPKRECGLHTRARADFTREGWRPQQGLCLSGRGRFREKCPRLAAPKMPPNGMLKVSVRQRHYRTVWLTRGTDGTRAPQARPQTATARLPIGQGEALPPQARLGRTHASG